MNTMNEPAKCNNYKYLNPGPRRFVLSRNSEIYVDKSDIFEHLNKFYDTEDRFICVSRPRRFGKSMTAGMISAYYDRTCDGGHLFEGLKIMDSDNNGNMNVSDVIFINMQDFLSDNSDIDRLIANLKAAVVKDLDSEYPGIIEDGVRDFSNAFMDVYLKTSTEFVIIIDEWDCIFREYKEDKAAQEKYLDFLRDWLKDKAYIGLAYMTGILPIKKYGTHSALNMFKEYSMMNAIPLDSFVGFTSEEVIGLCNRYSVSFDEVRSWYDGYSLKNIGEIYSPKSVVECVKTGLFDDYWNKTETFDALRDYIDMNYDGLRDAVIRLISGNRIKIDTRTFSNDMTTFTGYQDVLTLFVHLGYLGFDFDTKEVFIPNREVMMEFVASTSASRWPEVINSVTKSDRLLDATWNGDCETVAEFIEQAHLETSHIQYNDENALSYTISLAYYSAREYYTIVREFPSGKGFADLAFIPRKKYPGKPAMIVELKWDKTADGAISQIKEKNYMAGLEDYIDNLLLVGINYDRTSRKHACIIEKL